MGKRYATCLVFALAVAVGIDIFMDVPVPDICDSLDPDGWLYWLLGCGKASAGGGGGGAG